jgi:hypothetical protein
MEQLVSFVAVAVFTGFFAQAWKGRTGVLWGLIPLPIHYFLYDVFYRTVTITPDLVAKTTGPNAAFGPELVAAVSSGFLVGAIMFLIVATLPNRHAARTT